MKRLTFGQHGLLVLASLMAFFLFGCHNSFYDHDNNYQGDGYAPERPTSLTSTTGDQAVYLDWSPSQDSNVEGYYVYRSSSADGRYYYQATVYHTYWTDTDVTNGVTYYYAVSAFDLDGNESALTREDVFDTPRPEGYHVSVYDRLADPSESGYDLSEFSVLAWDYPTADFYFEQEVSSGLYFIWDANGNTNFQDMGPTRGLEDVTWAPETGWTAGGSGIEAISGHTVLVWTADNHYAQVRVTSLGGGRMTFDWAYQTASGNPELKLRLAADSGRR